MISTDVMVQLLTAIGGLAGLGSVANAFYSRRKAPADAASILTNAASGLVHDLTERIGVLEDRQRRQEVLNREHRRWDAEMVMRLKSAGIDVPEPPTLNVDH